MKKLLLLLILLCIGSLGFSQSDAQKAAQEAERQKKLDAAMAMEAKEGWSTKGGLGLDLGQLVNINPYVGAGSNRIGLGGAIGFNANYKKSRMDWKNAILLNLSTQRIGSGIIAQGTDSKIPLEKALDIFQFSSNVAYQLKEGSKWSYSFDLGLLTQLLASHVDSATSKIYLSERQAGPYNTSLKSKFMSPGLVTLAPGIKYVHDKHFSAFLSPCGGRILVVGDQAIANLGIHGTDKKDDGSFETTRFELGALAKMAYVNTFFTKLNFNSELTLFSNYLDKPKNIDVIWTNGIGVEIFKGLNLGVQGNLFYDDNRTNNVTDGDAVGGFSGQGKRVNFIEQILLSYSRNF